MPPSALPSLPTLCIPPSLPFVAAGVGCQLRGKTRLPLRELQQTTRTPFCFSPYVMAVTETVLELDHIVRSGEPSLRA